MFIISMLISTMKSLKVIFLTVFVGCVTAQRNPGVDQRCMECICQASTNCARNLKCQATGGKANYCGPYAISWAYWHDAGKPNDYGGTHDPEICMENKICSERAVRGYMRRYGQDCDGNGVIDCLDFSRIHKLGPNQCSANIQATSSTYWKRFVGCYNRFGYKVDVTSNHDRATTIATFYKPLHVNVGGPYKPPNVKVDRPYKHPNVNVDVPYHDPNGNSGPRYKFGDRLPKSQFTQTHIVHLKPSTFQNNFGQNDNPNKFGQNNINYNNQNNNANKYGQNNINYNNQNDNANTRKYGQNDNANKYGQNNINYYGENDNANNYRQNNNLNNYGSNNNPNNYSPYNNPNYSPYNNINYSPNNIPNNHGPKVNTNFYNRNDNANTYVQAHNTKYDQTNTANQYGVGQMQPQRFPNSPSNPYAK